MILNGKIVTKPSACSDVVHTLEKDVGVRNSAGGLEHLHSIV